MENINFTKEQLFEELQKSRQQCAELLQKESRCNTLLEEFYLFKSIIESSPEAIAISDPDGHLVYINPAHEKLFSRTLAEARELNYRDYYPSESLEILNREVMPALENGQCWEGELEVLDAHGRRFMLWEHAGSIRDESGKMQYGFGMMHDSSKNKRTKDLLRIQRDLAIRLSSTNDLHSMLSHILKAACQIDEIDCGGVYLVDHEKRSIDLAYHEGLPDEFIREASCYSFDTPQADFVFSKNPFYGNYNQLKSISAKACQKENLKAVTIIPVQFNDEVVALLNLASHVYEEIPEITRDALEAIASQIGGAIARIKNQLKVEKSQQNFQNLINEMNDFLLILDKTGHIIYFNPVVEQRLGYSRETLLRMTAADLHPKERRQEALEIISAMLAGKRQSCPIPLVKNDGTLIPVETKVTKGYWDDEAVLFGISRDISEQLAAEKALQQAHDELEKKVQSRTGELVQANQHLKQEITEREKAEKAAKQYIRELKFLSEAVFEFVDLAYDDDFFEFIGRKLEEITGNAIVIISSFDNKQNSFHLKYIGGLGKNADEIIRLVGRKLKGFTATLKGEFAKTELLKGELVPVAGGLCELSFEEIPREVCRSIEKLMGMQAIYTIGLARKNNLYGTVNLISRKKQPIENQNIIEAFVNQVTMVYERKRAEDAVKMNEEKFRMIFEQSPISIELYDANGQLIDANPACLSVFGVDSLDELKGFKLFDDPNVSAANKNDFLQGKTVQYEAEFDFELVKKHHLYQTSKSGRRWLQVIIDPLIVDDHPYVYLVHVQDINRRKQYEAEIIKTEKLKSLGVLAGGIAHDFNNLLTGIIGNVSLAKLYEDSWSEVISLLNEAEDAAFRARNLTQQLLTFSRGGAPVKKLMSIQNLVRDTAVFVLRGSKSCCEFTIEPNLWTSEMDEGQISQVIQNLVLNADDAMPNGGKVMISCENVEVGETDAQSMIPGKYIQISVRDSGIGISEENLKRIFDPYFSTKDTDSGLGLTTAYSIIQKHNGYITAQSELGKGACFSVYLPASAEKTATIDGIALQPSGEKGRILVMDDEEYVQKLSGRMLMKMGFEVDYASDGSQAIAKYREMKNLKRPYTLLLIDLTIPGGMGGKQTIQELLKIDPNVKAVVSSGYSNDLSLAEFDKYGFKGMITKPYQYDDLQKVIKRVLELPD